MVKFLAVIVTITKGKMPIAIHQEIGKSLEGINIVQRRWLRMKSFEIEEVEEFIDKIIEVVANSLHEFQGGLQNVADDPLYESQITQPEWLLRYRTEALFHRQVHSFTEKLLEVIFNTPEEK